MKGPSILSCVVFAAALVLSGCAHSGQSSSTSAGVATVTRWSEDVATVWAKVLDPGEVQVTMVTGAPIPIFESRPGDVLASLSGYATSGRVRPIGDVLDGLRSGPFAPYLTDRSVLEITLGRYISRDGPAVGRAVYMVRGGRSPCAPAGPAPTVSECTATILADAESGALLLTEESGAPAIVTPPVAPPSSAR